MMATKSHIAKTSASEIKNLDPLKLKLDAHNPRLSLEEEGSDQPKLLEIMIKRFKVEEIAESILAAGYLPFDPLIGLAEANDVTILEGNRRVAAIQLLLEPEKAPEKFRLKWIGLSKRLPKKTREDLAAIKVEVHKNRDDFNVRSYIGFRHVTGVLKWPSLEKAGFIAELIEEDHWSYAQVADRLGSYPRHVEKHYVAYKLVRQSAGLQVKGTENMERAFGVLLRGLQAGGISDFLGVKYPNNPKSSRNPVPPSKRDNLSEFVLWTFGTEDRSRILKDSRDLTKWGKILNSPAALGYLRRTAQPSFDRAWAKSGGQVESLAEALYTAADRLEESVPLVPLHKNDKEVLEAVLACTRFLVQILGSFPDVCSREGITLKHVRST
jgi:hypothetical protein